MTSLSPVFATPNTSTFVDVLKKRLNANLKKINSLLTTTQAFTWENLIQPLDDMDDELDCFWAPLSHLHAVMDSEELRTCYEACLPELSAYEASISHNHALYKAIESLSKTALNPVQRKIVKDMLRDFELSGVNLDEAKKNRFEAIQTRLSELSNRYENNILDATHAYTLHITDEKRLAGLTAHAMREAKELAQEKNLEGFVLSLEFPSYIAVMTHAEDRKLREEIYHAYVTRASDIGPNAGQFDNTEIMQEILALRHEKSQLLGFKHYAELSLASKMAESVKTVDDFLGDLITRGYAKACAEFDALRDFAQKTCGYDALYPWDIAYVSEKKQHTLFAISQETLRPYFPLSQVMDGLIKILQKLYGITMDYVPEIKGWHPDVRCYGFSDEKGLRGYIYMDLFARPHKRGGAWMNSLQTRRKLADGSIKTPVATLTCNFTKTGPGQEATFSHDEVLTLFHELGHCLHHILTKVDYLHASGINGVEWDAVELPSQLFENWCWEEETLALLTRHIISGETLPMDWIQRLLSSKNFQAAMALMRQLEFSVFDFQIHSENSLNKPNFIANILEKVRKQTTVVPIASYNRFEHSFSHIFAGGYAAGYYSYKWAEVLSADAYACFEEEGILNPDTGRRLLQTILEVGGSHKASEAFQSFRGRAPSIDALLRHNGITS